METITSAASRATSAATHMVWGEDGGSTAQANETGGQEPISGKQGKGTVDEPYDQGNAVRPMGAANTAATPADAKPAVNPHNAASGVPQPEHSTDKTGVVKGMGQPTAMGSDVVPSEAQANPGAAPASGAAPFQKQQGADRPHAAPSAEEAQAVKASKDEGEEALKKRDPNDHSGEPLHVHIGNEEHERNESKGDRDPTEEPKGTGEKFVKSTGLAADGGDFDVTKPGAGREAERLKAEKGMLGDDQSQASVEEKHESKHTEKPSMGDKIKNKLHIGHKDK